VLVSPTDPLVTSALPAYITHDPDNKKISVYTATQDHDGDYIIRVIATLNDGPETKNIDYEYTLTIVSGCPGDVVSLQTAFPDTLYYFGTTTPNNQLDVGSGFTQTDTGCPLTYALVQDGWGGAGDYNADIISGFDVVTGVITVFTTNEAVYDKTSHTFTVTVTSTTSNPVSTVSDTFDLEIKSQCWDVVLTAPSFISTSETFELFATQSIEFNEAVDTTLSGSCGAFTYVLYNVADDSQVDPATYSINTADPTTPLIEATPDVRATWIKTHNFYIVATYDSYESVNSSNNLQLEITEPCLTTVISDTVVFSKMTASVKGPTVEQIFLTHKDSKSELYSTTFGDGTETDICGPRRYQILFTPTLNPDTVITQFVVVDANTMKLTLQTDTFTHAGTYAVQVTVDLQDYSITPKTEALFEVVIDECVPTITPGAVPTPPDYTVLDVAQTISLQAYTQSPGCGYSFSYSAKWIDGVEKDLPAFIVFNSGLEPPTFTVSTST